uniref:PDZ domain-containing protein n=1 Tax=Globisporangium ultimum (strain ATCC 200006 / CBS 805.95 / DAOM BR144) TaxID=431595 RepID=K3WBT3_GLOUD
MSTLEFRDTITSRGSGQARDSMIQREANYDGPAIVLDERKMYTVDWLDGSTFGFTVTPVNSDRGTVLLLAKRTAPKANLEFSGLEEVLPGDMIVAIGEQRVYHLGAENATKYLRSVHKPVRLTLQLSPFGDTGKNIPDLAPNEYDYLWESGPLGLVLTPDEKSKIPIVKRINAEKVTNPALLRDVRVGDELIYANDIPTCEYSMSAIIKIIRDLPKPIMLRFRKPLKEHLNVEIPELKKDEYDFLWEYGPLGLVVGESRAGLPFVRSFTGKGTSRQIGLVQSNDEIVMVNDQSTERLGFAETMNYIMSMPKPAVLRFRRRKEDAETDPVRKLSMSTMNISTVNKPPQPQQQSQQQLPQQLNQQKQSKPELRDFSYSAPTPIPVPVPVPAPVPVQGKQSPPRQHEVAAVPSILGYNADRMSSAAGRHNSFSNNQVEEAQAPMNVNNNSEDYFTIDQSAFYQIQWTDGPFGLTVREAMSKLGAVMLITKRTGKSTCAGLKRVAVGDILVRIGEKNVGELGFDQGTRYLRTVQKPVVLTFQAID